MKHEVVCINRTRRRIPTERIQYDIRAAVAEVRRKRWTGRLPPVITVVFLPDRESALLNRRFRKKSRAANVLSFHFGREGEVIVAPATISREAHSRGHPFGEELRRMVIHGLIHLTGQHHESSRRAGARFNRMAFHLERHLRIQLAGRRGVEPIRSGRA